MDAVVSNISPKGKINVPVNILKQAGLKNGSKVFVKLENNQIVIKKIPTANDWKKITSKIAVEKVELDENGHYDPKKAPSFHDWMVNG